jgi:hypothetical protein
VSSAAAIFVSVSALPSHSLAIAMAPSANHAIKNSFLRKSTYAHALAFNYSRERRFLQEEVSCSPEIAMKLVR